MFAVSFRSAVLFLALAGVAAAQTNHGTITGTVQDPATAVVPNAAVIATNVETGAVYQTLATATGNFTVPSLPAGNYSVSVEAPEITFEGGLGGNNLMDILKNLEGAPEDVKPTPEGKPASVCAPDLVF